METILTSGHEQSYQSKPKNQTNYPPNQQWAELYSFKILLYNIFWINPWVRKRRGGWHELEYSGNSWVLESVCLGSGNKLSTEPVSSFCSWDSTDEDNDECECDKDPVYPRQQERRKIPKKSDKLLFRSIPKDTWEVGIVPVKPCETFQSVQLSTINVVRCST